MSLKICTNRGHIFQNKLRNAGHATENNNNAGAK